MARDVEQRSVRDCWRRRSSPRRATRRAQGADRKGRRAARRHADDDVVGGNLGVRHGLGAGRLVVLGLLGALDQRANSRPPWQTPRGRRASYRWASARFRPARRCARTYQLRHRRSVRLARAPARRPRRPRRSRRGAANRSGRSKLPLVHGRDHLGCRPGIELDVAWAHLLCGHGPVSVRLVNAVGIRSIPCAPRALGLRRGTPGETQGTIHRIALDRNQPSLDIRRQPRLHRRCEPAEQRDAGSAAFRQPAHQFVDLLRSVPDDRRATESPASACRITSGAKVA